MPLIAKVGREHLRVRFLIIVITVFLWIGIFLHLFPVWWMFTTSIKPVGEIFKFPPTIWPKNPNFNIYRLIFYLSDTIWGGYPIFMYIKNSFIMTGGIMVMQIPLTALLAYALSKLSSPRWGRILFLFCIGTMVVPAQISFVPHFLLIRHFPFPTMSVPNIPLINIPFPTYDFMNTYWAVILPGVYNAFNILLFKGFFDGIPDELINAARLDGASEFGIFRRIILPVSKPVFAVVAYFTFSGAWNNFMWPLLVIQDTKLYPLSVYIYKFQDYLMYHEPGLEGPQERAFAEAGIGYNGLMAVSIIESIPVFIMFLIFREYLMTGIRLRGFK